MANNTFEFQSKTVEKAIENGLVQLNIEREQAEIEIIQRGRSGFLGIGSELAIVNITPLVDSYTIPTVTIHDDEAEPSSSIAAADVSAEEEHPIIDEASSGVSLEVSEDASMDDDEQALHEFSVDTDGVTHDLDVDDSPPTAADSPEASSIIRDEYEERAENVWQDHSESQRGDREEEDDRPRGSRRWRRVSRDELPPDEYAVVSGIPGTDDADVNEILEYATDLMTPEVSNAELEDMAVGMLEKIIDLMGFEATVEASWQTTVNEAEEPYLQLDVFGDDVGPLIGRRGETLDCIQYLVRLMVNQQLKQWKNIIIDIEHYKSRRMDQLMQMAHRLARQVADTGRSFVMEPMPANERRLVHLALRHNSDVVTESLGDGERRQVQIVPKY